MLADQAIFTSLTRRGKSGYHVVARSAGVTENEATTLAAWSPSHGGLLVDDANRVSVNFHPLPTGRYALSRTREGRPEYSGRGGRQVYTHALIVDAAQLSHAGFRPFAIYRDALALGYLHYRPDPAPVLEQVRLSSLYSRNEADDWAAYSRELGHQLFESIMVQLEAAQNVVLAYAGDRAALAEVLVSRLSPQALMKTSFATSLVPSSVRAYHLEITAPKA